MLITLYFSIKIHIPYKGDGLGVVISIILRSILGNYGNSFFSKCGVE